MTRRLGTSSGRDYCAFPCGAASCKSRTGACAARQPRRAHASHAARACSCDGSAVEHARLQLAGYLAARDARRSAQAGTLTAGEAALLTERDELVAFALDPAGSGATAAVAWQGAMAVSGSEESPVACDVVALGALLARVQAVLKKEGLLDALEGGVDTAVRHGGMQRQHNMLDKRPCRAGRVGARRRAISATAMPSAGARTGSLRTNEQHLTCARGPLCAQANSPDSDSLLHALRAEERRVVAAPRGGGRAVDGGHAEVAHTLATRHASLSPEGHRALPGGRRLLARRRGHANACRRSRRQQSCGRTMSRSAPSGRCSATRRTGAVRARQHTRDGRMRITRPDASRCRSRWWTRFARTLRHPLQSAPQGAPRLLQQRSELAVW